MRKATLTPVGSLKDFCSLPGTQKSLEITFELQPSVKDVIESKGIPHTAVFDLEVNGEKRGLDYNLQDGDEIVVYPIEEIDHRTVDPIFTEPNAFICDGHLGKLAKTLRLLGFDAMLNDQWDDKAIIQRSNTQNRMILTRDLELLKNGKTKYGYWIRSTNPDRQIEELFRRFALSDHINPFTRCMRCNGRLAEIPLEQVTDRVPPKVKEWHSEYWQCSKCHQVYWQGSHYKQLQEKVERLTK